MENKKTKIISIIAIIALVLTLVTATYAYFQAQTGEGSQADVKINASTVDTLTFETGSSLTFTADQETFSKGKASLSDTTFAKAILTANNKTNSATNNYSLYLNISDNNFMYTQDTSTPELLLQITDGSNNSITSINGLTYKTITDNQNTSISGFDITNKTGLINLFINREITTTSTKTEEWTIKITFVNYDADQSGNAGKSFDGQVLISKDSFENYTPNTINTLSATKSGTSLTVNLNVEQGSNEIDKYYYAIEETNGIAMLENTSKIQRLSNTLSASNLTYIESNSSTYTFTNLSSSKDYKVSAYAIDKKKIRSNTYEYNVYSGTYVYPSITNVTTTSNSNSITATVTASKGTNNISKYFYSIDGGNSFIESTSNSYTFSNLVKGSNYRIAIKVMDSNKKYSNVYVTNVATATTLTLANYVISQYGNKQGNNNIYHHDGTLENGIDDGSYRYAGPSDSVNNYVCFGSDAATCPEDNLYRIIGVFDGKVKLIKKDFATSTLLGTDGSYVSNNKYKWTNLMSCPSSLSYNLDVGMNFMANKNDIAVSELGGCNKWQYSELNTVNLNTNFINNIGKTWTDKIVLTDWKVSGGGWPDIANGVIPSSAYQKEIVNAKTTYEAKVGLMYVTDYYFAASPSAWALPGFVNDSSNDYKSVTSINWMFKDSEVTITPNSVLTTAVYIISNDGSISPIDSGNNSENIRPTFFLNSDIIYKSGNGNISNPIRIS